MLKIDCYLSESCLSKKELLENINAALKLENTKADVSIVRLDERKAASLGLRGSPAIFFKNIEVMPGIEDGFHDGFLRMSPGDSDQFLQWNP